MDNKDIANLLKEAVQTSQMKEPVIGNTCGFEVVTGYRTVTDGAKLKAKIDALVSVLEVV